MLKKKFNVFKITDVVPQKGIGNYLRSRELSRYLKEKKISNELIFYNQLSSGTSKVYTVIILDLPNKIYSFNSIKRYKKFFNPNVLLVGLDYVHKLKIDINISLLFKSKFAKKNFVGTKYAIIGKKIQEIKKKQSTNNKNFFISIGSSDLKNLRQKIYDRAKLYFHNIYINKKKKLADIQNNKTNITYYKFLSKSKFVACNAGTTLLEMLYLKKYIYSFPQNREENIFAKYLFKIGYKFNINYFDFKKKSLFSGKQKNLDSRGMFRILNIIKKSI